MEECKEDSYKGETNGIGRVDEQYDCDVCAINETGLNGNEYVWVGDEYKWIGTNKDLMKGKTGGIGFIIKRSLECKRVIYEIEDVCYLKVGTQAQRYERLLGSIYMNCEGVRGDENVFKKCCM